MGQNRLKTAAGIIFISGFVLTALKSAQASEPGLDINISATALNGDSVGHEGEMMIDVDPTNPNHMVVFCHGTVEDVIQSEEWEGWEDDYPSFLNFFYTIDGGASWTRIPIGSNLDGINEDLNDDTDDDNPEDVRSDPVVAFADDGTLYIGYITLPDYDRYSVVKKIIVARGVYSDSAQTYIFDNFREVGGPAYLDKVQLATGPDPDSPGRYVVYATWWDSDIMVAHSTDSGDTWSSPQIIYSNVDDTRFTDPAVGPDGTLYVAWQQGSVMKVAIDSSDRGDSFETILDVATGINMVLQEVISAAPERGIPVGTVLDVDRSGGPFNGRVYLAYCNYEAGETTDNANIYFQYYDPNASAPTWSSPVRINHIVGDAQNQISQFLPWLDVNQETGTVAVAWYDARDDVDNAQVHVYTNYSLDGGATFQSTDYRLSDDPSDESGELGNDDTPYTWHRDYLEYIGVVAYGTGENEAIRAIWAGDPVFAETQLQADYDLDIYTDYLLLNGSSAKVQGRSISLSYPKKITYSYTYPVRNNGTEPTTVELRFAVPPSSSVLPNQDILNVEYFPDTMDFEIDEWGQRVAIYEQTLAPGEETTAGYEVEAIVYDMSYHIDPEQVDGDIPQDILNAYTADVETMYAIYDPIIQDAVAEAVGDETNLYQKAKLLHDYVMAHIDYEFDGVWDPAPTVLANGGGSCSEYVILYIALCRAAGIPARYVSSTVLGNSGGPAQTLPYFDDMYHRWTEVYLPGYGWVPVDVTWDDSTGSDMYFGTTPNWLVASSISGGPSSLLGWNHHSAGSWTGDVEILEGIGAEWTEWESATPKEIKEDAADILEQYQTGDTAIDSVIAKSAADIRGSLDDGYWLDDSHLSPTGGRTVFYMASWAIWRLSTVELEDNSVIESVLEKLIAADDLLAETAVDEATTLSADCEDFDWIVAMKLDWADDSLYDAQVHHDASAYPLTLWYEMNAWTLAQEAIEWASLSCWQGPADECESNADCDDGLSCNGGETCVEGFCRAGGAGCEVEETCVSGDDCLSGFCDGGSCDIPESGDCTEATAVDLGADGNETTVPTNGCVMVRDQYPFWWGVRTMLFQTTSPGNYPVSFTWSNACTGSGGSGTFTVDWDNQWLSLTDPDCATLINLQGDGSGTIRLRYYGG